MEGWAGPRVCDAIDIDSADVRARLDALLASGGAEVKGELEYGSEGAEFGGINAEEVEVEETRARGGADVDESVDAAEEAEVEVERRADEKQAKHALVGPYAPGYERDPTDEEEAANMLCTPPSSAFAAAFPGTHVSA